MNKQVKAALSAVRDLISGGSSEAKVADAGDKDTRRAVSAELLAAMRRGAAPSSLEPGSDKDPQQIAQELERSRQLFMELGFFDEAVQDLRAANSATERAAAARALGLVGSHRASVHLVAAMFDSDVEVRNAAGEALTQVGDPTVTTDPLTKIYAGEPAVIEPLDLEEPSAPEHEAPISLEAATADVLVAEEPELVVPSDSAAESPPSGFPLIENSQPSLATDTTVAQEEQLLLEEHAARETIAEYERVLTVSAVSRQKAENEAKWRAEREAKIAAEAESRRAAEEEQRQRTEGEASRRRAIESESLAAESSARQQAEAEVHRLIQEETRLRVETTNLRRAADQLSRNRRQLEATRREEAEAAHLAEATRARQQAENLHQKEVERLQNEEQALRFAVEETVLRRSELETSRNNAEAEIAALKDERTRLVTAAAVEVRQFKDELEQILSTEAARRAEADRLRLEAEERRSSEDDQLRQQLEALNKATSEVAARRSEVEDARARAEQDSQRLTESLARMRAAEEKRAFAEQERLQVEATTNERVANEERLLSEARSRAASEQARLDEEKRRHDESEEHRMAALEEVHRQTELEAKQRADREKHLLNEIDHLRIEDAEARRRIEDAETLKRASEQAYRVAAEKVQRTEAEAHAANLQEMQALAKLEAVRRDLAVQAQARAAQEKRIREEIEAFQKLQDEERPRVEAAILQRTAAAARLQQLRELENAPPSHRNQINGSSNSTKPGDAEGIEGRSFEPGPRDEGLRLVSRTNADVEIDPQGSDDTWKQMQPAIGLYLTSLDPYKRAAAVTELARSSGVGAFAEIAKCFDDSSAQVRNAAARALCQLEPSRTVDFFNRALEEGSGERRRNIGNAIAGSGLATEAIDNLASETREDTYNALSILFVMAKTGEVQPLIKAIEEHENPEVTRAVVKLLNLSGHSEMAEAAVARREHR